MRSKIQQWGDSLAFRIPKAFAEEIGLRRHTDVDVAVDGGKLVIFPTRELEPTLEELLAEVHDENLHREIVTGPPVGKEVW